MKKLRGSLNVILIIIIAFTYLPAKNDDLIKKINKNVLKIQQSIKEGYYGKIYFEHTPKSGNINSKITFYYDKGQKGLLKSAKLTKYENGNKNEFNFYYYDSGKFMKFAMTTPGRLNNQPKKEIFFDKRGLFIWNNFKKKPPMNPYILKEIFLSIKGFLDVKL